MKLSGSEAGLLIGVKNDDVGLQQMEYNNA